MNAPQVLATHLQHPTGHGSRGVSDEGKCYIPKPDQTFPCSYVREREQSYHPIAATWSNPAINAGSVRNPTNETLFVPPSAVSHASRQSVEFGSQIVKPDAQHFKKSVSTCAIYPSHTKNYHLGHWRRIIHWRGYEDCYECWRSTQQESSLREWSILRLHVFTSHPLNADK
jgi:hypothetical protein